MASSTRSVASLDGLQSLSSEEMAAFIAGVKARTINTDYNEDGEDGCETETNEGEEDDHCHWGRMNGNKTNGIKSKKKSGTAESNSSIPQSPDNEKNGSITENGINETTHNETSDSGLSLNENVHN